MELKISNNSLNIQDSKINCIMGDLIDNQKIIETSFNNPDIGYVLEPLLNQIFHRNVYEYLEYMVDNLNYFQGDKQVKIINSLRMVGLDDQYLKRKIESLSSSELYRIVLAGALIINPRILIINNPSSYLDINNISILTKIIRTIKRRYDKTIIILSNDSDFVLEVADNIIVLSNEKVILEGDKFSVFDQEEKIKKCQVSLPKIIQFEKKVLQKKKIDMGFRDNINDLLKDIYFFK